MFKPFKETSREWIINENKRLFNIDVCKTCQSQHFEGYARLKNYYLNEEIMAKKNTVAPIVEASKEGGQLKLKSEFVGGLFCNGAISIELNDVDPSKATEIFTTEEISTYFEYSF